MVIAFKWITYVVGIFFLCSLFSMMYLRQYYTRHMPQTVQIESGRILPVEVNYGKVVYVNEQEKRSLNTRTYVFIAACVLVVLVVFAKPFVSQMSLKG